MDSASTQYFFGKHFQCTLKAEYGKNSNAQRGGKYGTLSTEKT